MSRRLFPLPAQARAGAVRGGLKARLKSRLSRARAFDDESGPTTRPTPSLPKLKFMEREELPPYDVWARS
jgi:hypothetical protein